MARLIVRGLSRELVGRLATRAALHGRSVEEEHRAILIAALSPKRRKTPLKELLLAMPDVGEDVDFERVR